jgi:hypothetical protein
MWGVVTRSEIMTVRYAVANDPLFKTALSQLIDVQEASTSAITTQDVQALAFSNVDPVARRAFVARNPDAFGLARMFHALHSLKHSHEQVNVFRTMAEAEAWLGLTPKG